VKSSSRKGGSRQRARPGPIRVPDRECETALETRASSPNSREPSIRCGHQRLPATRRLRVSPHPAISSDPPPANPARCNRRGPETPPQPQASEPGTAAMAAAAVASSSTPRPLRLAPRRALGGAPDHVNAPPLRSRRPRLAVSASAGAEAEAGGSERFYFNFTGFPFPLGPFLNRRTIRTEVTSRLSPEGSFAFFFLFAPRRRPDAGEFPHD
jgi:hypothetical protein